MSVHTYIRHSKDKYSVGMWLPNSMGNATFFSMFDVSDISCAMRAVRMLNGGDAYVGDILKTITTEY